MQRGKEDDGGGFRSTQLTWVNVQYTQEADRVNENWKLRPLWTADRYHYTHLHGNCSLASHAPFGQLIATTTLIFMVTVPWHMLQEVMEPEETECCSFVNI